jgi:hypothetical protein
LRTLYQFATDMNCHVQVLAHPAKMERISSRTGSTLEDIAGAKHWDNVVDQGFTVRSKPENTSSSIMRYEKNCQRVLTVFLIGPGRHAPSAGVRASVSTRR